MSSGTNLHHAPPRSAKWPGAARAAVIIGVIGALLIAALMVRHSKASAQSLPAGLTLSADTISLGVLSIGTTGQGSFILTNSGPSTFTIKKVVPECGCTVAAVSREALPPGSAATISVYVKASKWGDGFRKKRIGVVVQSGDGHESSFALNVAAAVDQVFDVSIAPNRFRLPNVRNGETHQLTMYVRGDKAWLDAIPDKLDFRTKHSLEFNAGSPEGRRGSKAISLLVTPTDVSASHARVDVVEIVLTGKYVKKLDIPIEYRLGE